MMKKTPTFRDKPLSQSLSGLERFGITSKSTSSRAASEREDIAFGVRSLRDLERELSRGFADPDRPTPSSKRTSKMRK